MPEFALCLAPSKAGGGPMALEMELWPISDGDMVSESSTDAVEAVLAVAVFFFGSDSRGSSWQR